MRNFPRLMRQSRFGQSRFGRSRFAQRGAAAVEFALVLPILALMAFGAAEMGAAWSDSQTVLTSTRSAARSLAQYGDEELADLDALLSIEAAYANSDLTVVGVIIYESDDAVNGGGAPTECVTAVQATNRYSGGENCNVYSDTRYANAIAGGGDTSKFGCTGGDLDRNWCPADRDRAQATATYMGVQVFVARNTVTGSDLLPVPTELDQFSVMRMEPLPS